MTMVDIELPACFYLGKEYDLARKTVLDTPVMYDAHYLTTHGVVVGMTGSGKTGLCLSLLEEAAIDGIPCIMIDLKGDISNLLLNFPELRPEDFQTWINPDDARRKKMSLKDFAVKTSDTWKKGLADWGQGPERVARLRQSSEWRIYTPGSDAGLPVSIIQTFSAPKTPLSREALNERVDATASALLGLTNLADDPVQSREHILVAHLLLNAWLAGRDMDLPRLISQIQVPPLRKIGAFDVDTFYPEKDRLKLAVALNNILASPSFASWIHGEPLDLASMMYTADGRPRQLIFYLAHLDETQRMFFVALLLEEVLSWTRSQTGTTSLRALLYFDEVFGYLPPHPGNPPTKQPLMTLMKQARAFGVGVLLATQNPVDLDYKALTNAGTWFVGKLQTERDKARLLEGLEGVAAAQGTLTDRQHLDSVISSLGNRVFLLHNVHTGKPLLFHTRWAMSYLGGPLSRDQVARLMEPVKAELARTRKTADGADGDRSAAPSSTTAPGRTCPECNAALPGPVKFCPECGFRLPVRVQAAQEDQFKHGLETAAAPVADPVSTAHVPPILPPGLSQYFLSAVPLATRVGEQVTVTLHYEPRLFGAAEVSFSDDRKGVEHTRTYRLLTAPPRPGDAAAWALAESIPDSLTAAPDQGEACWADVPETVNDTKKIKSLERSLLDFLYENAALTIHHNRSLDLLGAPGETQEAFLQRCRDAARRASEEELAEVREKFRHKFDAVDVKLRQAQSETQWTKEENILNQSESLLDWLWSWGKKSTRTTRPTKAIRDSSRRVHKAQSELEKQQLAKQKLEEEWQAAAAKVAEKWQQKAEDIREIRLEPRKADIRVTRFGLAWAPFWHVGDRDSPAHVLPAYARQSAR
jgi:hypothetical protein